MKKILIPLFVILLFALLIYAAPESLLNSPADEAFLTNPNVTFDVSVTSGLSRNITNATIWTNWTGTWERNDTLTNGSYSDFTSTQGFQTLVLGTLNFSDGTHILWGVELTTNHSGLVTNTTFSSNRTFFIELPPDTLTFNSPAASESISNNSFDLNVSVSSIYTPTNTDTFTCNVFTNETVPSTAITSLLGTATIANGTSFKITVGVEEANDMMLQVVCWETGRDAVYSLTNLSINADRTAPTVVRTSDFLNDIDTDGNFEINYTITDLNPSEFIFFTNATGNWQRNLTRTSLSNGELVNFTIQNFADGNYTVGGWIWDVAGNNFTLPNYSLAVDSAAPTIEAQTNSTQNAFLTVQINWGTSEKSNASITFGNDTVDRSSYLEVDSSFDNTNFSINITVEEGLTYYYNLTSCDRAGNCAFTTEVLTTGPHSGIYAGWNAYGIFNAQTMGSIFNDSGADFVYWWNNTAQSWTNSLGTGSNADFTLQGGQVAWLFKNTAGTWTRDVNDPTNAFEVNLSSGANFVSAQVDYNFTNLTNSFTNITVRPVGTGAIPLGWTVGGSADGTGTQGVDVSEVEFYSFFNNSDQRYTSYFRNETFNNDTVIPKGFAIFVGTTLNITWNGSAIVSNWTITG